jgi:hypothetical protein
VEEENKQVEEEKSLAEQVEEIRRTNFKVTKIPVYVLREFKKLCKEEYGDVYWVGISELLKYKKKYEEISTLIFHLQKQIDDIQKKLNGKEEKQSLKTFG